jgi:lysophospholipase L1-like esterase
MMPWKTILTGVLFTAAMLALKVFDPQTIPEVWQMPVPKPPVFELPPVKRMAIPGSAEEKSPAYSNLSDPEHELDRFYAALSTGSAVVLHYGDSPTTADLITADARAMLQKQFGDAGSGFVLIARPWAWYGHRGVEMSSSGWKIDVAGATELKDGLHGLGAASFRGSAGATARWILKDPNHSSVEIAYLAQPEGGSFAMEAKGDADAVELGSADTSGEQGPGYASFDLPPGSTQITLRVSKGSVRLYGADFRKAGHGVVYSSLGINGANVTLLSRAMNGAHWAAQLRHYHPNLVVVAFGTNESGYPAFVNGTWAPELKAAVHRIQAAVPEASVLLMSPMDRGERKQSGEIGTIEGMPHLVELEAKTAAELGVAFFNTFEAMGGEGTMGKWYNGEPRLVGADFIHPMPAGARIVGELLYNALRDGYNEYKLKKIKELETRAEAQGSSRSEPSTERSEPLN